MPTFKDDAIKLEAVKLHKQQLTDTAISEKLQINRKTVSDFLAKRSYLSWWNEYEGNDVVVGILKTDEGRTQVANSFYVDKMHRRDICKRYNISRRTLTAFLSQERYKDFWESYSKYNKKRVGMIESQANKLSDDSAKAELAEMFYVHNKTVKEIVDETGLGRTTVKNFLSQVTHQKWWDENGIPTGGQIESEGQTDASVDDGEEEIEIPMNGTLDSPDKSYLKGERTRYVLTSCQNNTFIHDKFMTTLETYCEHNDAELLISPFVYNLSGILGHKKDDMLVWDERVQPYLVRDPIVLSEYLGGLVFNAQIDILPTAVNPLSGFQTLNKKASGIFPHTKMHLESVPTQKTDPTRMLYTTGAVSQRNYIPRKAGQKAEHHHVFGALIVEVDHDNKLWYVRQLNASNDGSFQDLTTFYSGKKVTENQHVEAITWGDIHSEHLTEERKDMCFRDEDSIINTLNPKYQFMHDLSDFAPRNHHNRKDPHFLYQTSLNETKTVEEGLELACRVLDIAEKEGCQTVVVNSNHDDALLKWLKEADYRTDYANGHFFLKCQLACYDAIADGDKNFMIFEKAMRELVSNPTKSDAIFLRTDEPFEICEDTGNPILMSMHGHLGSNGSRGSMNGFTKLGQRCVIGHGHGANIRDGVYQVGVMGGSPVGEDGHGIDMYYNKGASSWNASICATYPNGKRTIITAHGKNWHLK